MVSGSLVRVAGPLGCSLLQLVGGLVVGLLQAEAVLVASRGRQLWNGVGGVGGWPSSTGLSAAVWAVVTETCCGLGSLRSSYSRSAKL